MTITLSINQIARYLYATSAVDVLNSPDVRPLNGGQRQALIEIISQAAGIAAAALAPALSRAEFSETDALRFEFAVDIGLTVAALQAYVAAIALSLITHASPAADIAALSTLAAKANYAINPGDIPRIRMYN